MSEDKLAPNSRYAAVEKAELETPDGRRVVYLRRRFISKRSGPPIGSHEVVEGDRPDTVAAATLNDPELYWHIADANGVLDPADLTAEVGRLLIIALGGPFDA